MTTSPRTGLHIDPAILIAQHRLSVVTRQGDAELRRIQHMMDHPILVDGRADLENLLGRLLGAAKETGAAPKTLDLIGHSTPGESLLQLGDWVIDAASPTVTAFFRELADYEILPRLGIHALRLIGCGTAVTDRGHTTLGVLSDILGLEVYGTTGLIYNAHYDRHGFSDDWRFLLVPASEIRSTPVAAAAPGTSTPAAAAPSQRVLDVDRLPLVPLEDPAQTWPRRVATGEAARAILQLVRRTEGALMPGLLATPTCDLAFPAQDAANCYVVQIIFDGGFVRVHPDGPTLPGIVYPVTDPRALGELVKGLPIVTFGRDSRD